MLLLDMLVRTCALPCDAATMHRLAFCGVRQLKVFSLSLAIGVVLFSALDIWSLLV